ncbi:MAG TPA: bifunctional phosphopantothenoylcysteine decarboxylase/phosphopantothenate--cysteine ligase CoaBC [Crocinitomicaceae bacterium]|nr:bifunctional phosphopantothenoylcysteine decarboxylase/phosphopantothenate--cysteine ligase CoaBC [Crocinitomicaceae bacterium]
MSEDPKKRNNLGGKHILIGVTAGIAAYKIASLIRYFKKLEAEVKVIMTPASCSFITPLTLSTLSQNPVAIELFDEENGEWTNHVELALWADVMIIAPLSANTLAKMAIGQSDNLLLTTYLSAKCPVIVAPAMDLDMYQHSSTQENIALLEKAGVLVIPAETGFLASGLQGQGRMPEPEFIGDFVVEFLEDANRLNGVEVLITAGPTHEKIDPVRFIGNHSTGKMGYEIARSFLSRGAKVNLISGPTKLQLEHLNLTKIDIVSADEMLLEVQKIWDKCNIGVFSAAVADYKPKVVATQKIKKQADEFSIELVKNPDILSWAGSVKKNQYLVGFALETQNADEYAKNKLEVKNLNAIVVNSLEDKGAGFGFDTNKIKIIDRNNKMSSFELKQKQEVAKDIVSYIVENYEV